MHGEHSSESRRDVLTQQRDGQPEGRGGRQPHPPGLRFFGKKGLGPVGWSVYTYGLFFGKRDPHENNREPRGRAGSNLYRVTSSRPSDNLTQKTAKSNG